MIENFFRYRINVILLIFFISINSFEGRVNSDSYLISLSFAMIFSAIYIFNKATDIVEDSINFKSFPIKNKNYPIIFSVIFAIIPIPYLFFTNKILLLFYLFIPFLLGFLYSHQLKFLKIRRLKEIILLKNIISALVWALTPLTISFIFLGKINFLAFIHTFIMVFIIEVMWDIRDIEGDLVNRISTIPNKFGILFTKIICLSLSIGLLLFYNKNNLEFSVFLCAQILTILNILIIKKDSNPYLFQSLTIIWLFFNIFTFLKIL